MKKTIYEFVIDRLAASRGTWPSIAAGSGMSKRTIEKIARKEIKGPNVHHIQCLHDYFVRIANDERRR